jgi:hypothetical protein
MLRARPHGSISLQTAVCAIFDALSAGLAHYEAFENPPRLADWAECAAAVYEGTGWGREQFLDDWSVIEETQNATTLEGSPMAAAIVKFMEVPSHYEGPAGDLLEKLKETAEYMGLNPQYNKAFPQASNWVWKRIKPVKPTLDGYGIQADQVDRGRGKAKRMVIVLDRTGEAGPVTGVVGTVKTNLLAPQIWLRNREKLDR